MERNQSQQERAALVKLERIKLDQGQRADDLERDAAEAESKVTHLASPASLQHSCLEGLPAHTGLCCGTLCCNKLCTRLSEAVQEGSCWVYT